MMKKNSEGWVMPDFCRVATLLEVIILGEILAIILALLPTQTAVSFWQSLGLYSIFIQWIALTSIALLCLLRVPLQRLPAMTATVLSLLIILIVILLVGELSYRVYLSGLTPPVMGHAEFLMRAVAIGTLISAIALRYLIMQQRWRRNLEAMQRTRLETLQTRIQPHFLFNSLNTIASLIPERPSQAEGLIEDLSGLFRTSLAGERPLHSLDDELELTRAYLNLEQQRLGDRLQVEWQVESIPPMQVPPLILQPLVENAVRHGIEPLIEGGTVKLSLQRRGDGINIVVKNPLSSATSDGGHRMALANVEERLNNVFGESARLWRLEEGDRYTVEMWLPLRGKP
ncbi:MAG: histidine kinase [Gammaproteobacteria bacterium]|nr:histidine kinase [Gammaproteobacteria bacterium]